MKNSRPFSFKRFTINQDRAAMKVGTDGVLLGAWCTVGPETGRALDIGTGTGLIALMLAQRGEGWGLTVDALEPEPGAVADAAHNVAASPWPERVRVHGTPLQEFTHAGPYDLIVCNPPYFRDSLASPSACRNSARHEGDLTREELVRGAARLCRRGGRLAVVIPSEQAGDYIIECDMKDFAPVRRTDVITTPGSEPKRTLLEFVYRPAGAPPLRGERLVIQTAPMEHTPEYMALLREFYLKF